MAAFRHLTVFIAPRRTSRTNGAGSSPRRFPRRTNRCATDAARLSRGARGPTLRPVFTPTAPQALLAAHIGQTDCVTVLRNQMGDQRKGVGFPSGRY